MAIDGYALDAGPQWVSEYKQAHHDFASGIKQTQFQSVDYQSWYDEAWKDADYNTMITASKWTSTPFIGTKLTEETSRFVNEPQIISFGTLLAHAFSSLGPLNVTDGWVYNRGNIGQE